MSTDECQVKSGESSLSGDSMGGSRKKYLGGPGPSSFGRQQRLSEITIEPIISASSRTTVA